MSSKPSPSPFLLLGMGLSIAACLVAGMGLGYWIGESLGASLMLTFVGLGVGIVGAVATVRGQFRKYI
ncbi:MAG: hypothetical protein ACYCSF_11570 [Acidimicrobiales bacterium]